MYSNAHDFGPKGGPGLDPRNGSPMASSPFGPSITWSGGILPADQNIFGPSPLQGQNKNTPPQTGPGISGQTVQDGVLFSKADSAATDASELPNCPPESSAGRPLNKPLNCKNLNLPKPPRFCFYCNRPHAFDKRENRKNQTFWDTIFRGVCPSVIFVNGRDTKLPGFQPRLCPLVLRK